MSEIIEEIEKLKKDKSVIILAHTYQKSEIQSIADYVGDSYGLSVKATETDADVIIFCGVMFMAETAAILNPNKKVIIPEPNAGCPMADMISADELKEFKNKYPDYLVMCYVNSTAEVKALSDICCTSSNALKIVQQIPKDKGILFVPDQHLGNWVKEQTQHNMIMWEGFCPTHVRITPEAIEQTKKEHPDAVVLIHPEAPKNARDLADHVLSTGGMCTFVNESKNNKFIICTETGIIYTLRQQSPEKIFIPVSDQTLCPNMKKGSLQSVLNALNATGGQHVVVPEDIAAPARLSLQKMLDMSL